MHRVLVALVLLSSLAVSVSGQREALAISPGDDAFGRTWSRTDLPIAANQATRTWMWGPSAFTSAMEEWYTEGVGNARIVQYFDKTRMEITTDPNVNTSSIWYVTNGLLVNELVTGRLQLGNADFEQIEPAYINIAGDVGDSNSPTYAALAKRLSDSPTPVGTVITAAIGANGTVTHSEAFGDLFGVTASKYVPETNHTIAAPFWNFMNTTDTIYENGQYVVGQMFLNPYFATGYPISEPYWTEIHVGGGLTQVMLQCFERRCLTYTPSNAPEWQVEAGNVGQHYYRWRYKSEIPSEPPTVNLGEYQPVGPNFLPTWPVNQSGQALVSFGNQAPHPLTIRMDGPVSRTITLAACIGCPIYTPSAPPSFCRNDIPWNDEFLPPGNYRVQISWSGSDTTPLAGPLTYVPDAAYGTCFFILEDGSQPPPNPTPPSPPPPPPSNCHPSYPDHCISPPPPDLNCADLPSSWKPIRVVHNVPNPDPHDLDRDKDGWGCEFG